MPIGFYFAPPLFLYKGVTVYGVFVDDHTNKGLRKDKYGWSKFSSDEGQDSFDIKDLPNYQDEVEHVDLLKEAIDQGILSAKGLKHENLLTTGKAV